MADRSQYTQKRGAQSRGSARPQRGPQQPQEPKSKLTPTETPSSTTTSSEEPQSPSVPSSVPSQSTSVPPQTKEAPKTLDDQINQIEKGQEPDPLNDPVADFTPRSNEPEYVQQSAGPVFPMGPLDNELGAELPAQDPTARELSAPESVVVSEDETFYYNGIGQRVIKEGAPITIRGENVNGAIRVLDEIVQERRLPGSKRNGYWLLYAKNTLLPLSQVREANGLMAVQVR